MGQLLIYRSILNRKEPARLLYLAITQEVFQNIFEKDIGLLVIEDYDIDLLVFNPLTEEIVAWKP